MRRFVLLGALFLVFAALSSGAQTNPRDVAPNDSVFRRARQLVSGGNGAAGRTLVDSLLKGAEEGSTAYGDALYWRGALAETAAEAERDYRRVIVEYPVSHYTGDALLALALLEQARGNRASALLHLQRFIREHPTSPARGVAALVAARLAFEQRDTRAGCAMVSEARAAASATDVELRNQIDYFGTRCSATAATDASTSVASSGAAPPPTRNSTPIMRVPPKKTIADVAPKEVPKNDVPPPAPVQPKSPARASQMYTIQLAALPTRADADRLATTLAMRGVKARITGTTKPFRVRLAFYPTEQAAQEAVASLKQRGIIGFVTTETPARRQEKSP